MRSGASVTSAASLRSSSGRKKKKLECICRNKLECSGVSAVFKVLKDKRGCYVELPPTEMERTLMMLNRGEVPSIQDSIRVAKQLRAAYLRHLKVDEASLDENTSYYVALHHFHPTIVGDSHSPESDHRVAIVCRTVTEKSWRGSALGLKEEDRVPGTDSSFFVVPNYDFEQVKAEAQESFKAKRRESISSGQSVASGTSRGASVTSLQASAAQRKRWSSSPQSKLSSEGGLRASSLSPRKTKVSLSSYLDKKPPAHRPAEASSPKKGNPSGYYSRRDSNDSSSGSGSINLNDRHRRGARQDDEISALSNSIATEQFMPPDEDETVGVASAQSTSVSEKEAKQIAKQPKLVTPPSSPVETKRPKLSDKNDSTTPRSRVLSTRIVRSSRSLKDNSPIPQNSRRSMGPIDLDDLDLDTSSDDEDKKKSANSKNSAADKAVSPTRRQQKAFNKSMPTLQPEGNNSSSPRKIARTAKVSDSRRPAELESYFGRAPKSNGPVDLDVTIASTVASRSTIGLKENPSPSAEWDTADRSATGSDSKITESFNKQAQKLPPASALLSVSSDDSSMASKDVDIMPPPPAEDAIPEVEAENSENGEHNGGDQVLVFSAAAASATTTAAVKGAIKHKESKGRLKQAQSNNIVDDSMHSTGTETTTETFAIDKGPAAERKPISAFSTVPEEQPPDTPATPSPPRSAAAVARTSSSSRRKKRDTNDTNTTMDSSDFDSPVTVPSPVNAAGDGDDDDEPSLGIEDEEEFWDSSSDEASATGTTYTGGDSGPVDVDRLTNSFLHSKKSFKGARLHHLFEASVSEFSEDDDLSLEVVSRYIPPEELQPLKELTEKPLDRTESVAVLSAVESKRRCWSMGELDSLKVEWSCYKNLLTNAVKETDWIHDILKGSCQSIEAYSGILQAIQCDAFIDDAGLVVSSSRKRSKLASQRSSSLAQSKAVDSVMRPLFDMLLGTVDRVNESLPSLNTEVESFTELRTEVSARVTTLAKTGDRIVYDIELIESHIQGAWSDFEAAASKTANETKESHDDDWLMESQYKRAANFGTSVFRKTCEELKRVVVDIVKLDAERRNRTKEIILSFLPRRRRLCLRILEVFDPASSRLEEGRVDKDETEKELEKALENLSRNNLSKHMRGRSSIMNRSRTFKVDFNKGSPIDLSPVKKQGMFENLTLKEVKALEMKSGSKASWQTAVAVITVDKYLHVLTCESDSINESGNTGKTEKELIAKVEGRKPDLSLSLKECSSRLASGREHIEFTLDGHNALQKMLKRKVLLRLPTPKATSQWFEANEDLWSTTRGYSKKETAVHRV